ncbi:MAG: CHAP domain-containing protein, partial [Alphaproteobacteria bacterium]|nr:CHAP domain-containing protein [Alphaproteobacteria bacterium]
MRRAGLIVVALFAFLAGPALASPKSTKPGASQATQAKLAKPEADKRKAKTAVRALPAEPAINCVQFVKQNSDFRVIGDGWRWWDNAAGHYARGKTPEVGSVLVFKKAKRMVHGHVALVSDVVDKRTILVDHANWAPRGSGKG